MSTLRAEKAAGQVKYDMYREIQRRALGYSHDALTGGCLPVLNMALAGIVDDNTTYTDKAVSELMYYCRHHAMAWDDTSYPLAYDWLFNFMSAAQQDTVRNWIYSAFPDGTGGQRTVYYNLEANEAWDKGAAGLACYGDGGGSVMDQRFQALVDACDGRMRGAREFAWPNGTATSKGGVLPTRQLYFADGGYYKGNHYGQKDLGSILSYLFVFDDLGLGSYWDLCESFLDNSPEYYLRLKRPDGLSGRIMMGSIFGWDIRGRCSMAILSWKRRNPLATWIMSDSKFAYSSSGGGEWYLLYILYRPCTPAVTPDDLALYKFYGDQGSEPNIGKSWHEQIMTRTGWSRVKDCEDVYFHLTAGNYFGDSFNWFEPTFELYYRGAMAIRAGWYTAGDPDLYYYSNAVSCNSVVVFDSTQSRVNDRWGQDRLYAKDWGGPGPPVSIYDVKNDRGKYGQADISAFEVLPPGADDNARYYAKAMAYPSTAYYYTNSTRKVQRLDREFFWTGKNVVIADRVKIDRSVVGHKKIRWLMHTIEEPVMTSKLLYSKVADHIDLFEQGPYSSQRANLGYDGKITVTPLLPVGAELRRVGGTGYECWVDSDWNTGTNYPPSDESSFTNSYEVGRWRVETIAPGTPDSVDFLHAIYVGKSGDLPPRYTTLVGEGMLGCEIGGVGVVVFNRAKGGSPIRYSTTGDNLLLPQVVVGLTPDMAYLVTEGDRAPRPLVAGGGGVLCFDRESDGVVTILPVPLAWGGGSAQTGDLINSPGLDERVTLPGFPEQQRLPAEYRRAGYSRTAVLHTIRAER